MSDAEEFAFEVLRRLREERVCGSCWFWESNGGSWPDDGACSKYHRFARRSGTCPEWESVLKR